LNFIRADRALGFLFALKIPAVETNTETDYSPPVMPALVAGIHD
jgi:hypothetical protein